MLLAWDYFILLTLFSTSGAAYNILILAPHPSHSTQRAVAVLAENLIKQGHGITLVGPDAIPGMENQYTHVDLSEAYKFMLRENGTDEKIVLQEHTSKWNLLFVMDVLVSVSIKALSTTICKNFVQKVKDEKISYDVVIIQSFLPYLLVPMAHLIAGEKPVISFSTWSTGVTTEHAMGTIENFSFSPSILNDATDKMSLIGKIKNWYFEYYIQKGAKQIMTRRSDDFFQTHYGKKSEDIVKDVGSRISILMVASNFLYFYPRLLGPNIIEVGPMHLKSPQKLPPELQNWLDGAEKGAIYFSLGSNMKSKSLPESVRSNILKVFQELPTGHRVLWKWESNERLPGQPDNVLTQKWLPQHSILAHEKVKLFITQGGLQSFQETVHFGVPTVGIPWFSDQENNVLKMVDAGIGYRLGPEELTDYRKVKKAIDTVLFDESYSKKMKKLSAISRDFSAKSGEKAVFWVEHVTKHGGAHLKPITDNSTYFEFFCLDIISVVVVVCAVAAYFIYFVFKLILTLVYQKFCLKLKQS